MEKKSRTHKTTVSPRIEGGAYEWYAQTWDNNNQGAQYVLEAFPELYKHALRELRGKFTAGELSLMLDVQNGCFLMPKIAGQHLLPNCADGIALEGHDKKWKIDGDAFLARLKELSNFELAVLEIWAVAFWRQDKPEVEKWVAGLAKVKNEKK